MFSQISALLVARPRGYSSSQKLELEAVIRVAVREEFGVQDLLVITNMDFGHTDPQWIIPIGGRVELDPVAKCMKLLDPVCE